ncbi:hypothetical protein BDZ94DRAFT_1203063 [Collybia nuda]|uniref:RING-type domain-containing protein n=1 Tax=Collybia nuda TaxID=64659 RepID=A0A9P5XX70_9AGAR|nr:hypothetical protein BDZ94DRAFT_1203063 [Collybia nuda]
MATSRPHTHHSLPAPVIHAGFSISQSKSHVLAGVQDAYWSDDETEDAECPLCLEEMDISDLNFKPCICGYQICRFCWHHIKENLNKRCPACRRVYTDDAVEFKPIATQDHKRLTQQKKQRERERKELDQLGRRHLANVRVVQRNVVYVVGIGPRFAKEELIPTLRSSEYFGQYGKITKILLVKRTSSGGGAPVVGLYITYHRREDAARSIAAVDGTPSPGGGRELMRASYGTTKYCMSFLRGVSCSDHSCMNLHEWGDEKDCFTKEDLTTLKHTMKATESRARNVAVGNKKLDDQDGGLPRAAAWAQKTAINSVPQAPPAMSGHVISGSTVASRQTRRGGMSRPTRNLPTPTHSNDARAGTFQKLAQDRKEAASTKTPSQASSSRPSTPAFTPAIPRAATPIESKGPQQKKNVSPPPLLPPQSPALSTTAGSDRTSESQEPTTSQVRLVNSLYTGPSHMPNIPPGLPAVPPGLSAPPGIPVPSRSPRFETASPQTPLLASQSSYQMSTAARALLDDVKARRESAVPTSIGQSPFPDFDRTLQTLSGDGASFSFNLDPTLAGDEISQLPDFETEANIPFRGGYADAFPALRTSGSSSSAFMTPPGLTYPHHPNHPIYDPMVSRPSLVPPLEKPINGNSAYVGSFNPFADGNDDFSVPTASSLRGSHLTSSDDDTSRKMSRFGFARGRQGSTSTSSPLHAPSPLGNSNGDIQSFYNSTDGLPQSSSSIHWTRQDQGYGQPSSTMGSPLVQPMESVYAPPQMRFQPFDSGVSEAQLRDFIQSSRDRANSSNVHLSAPTENSFKLPVGLPPFNDPAIMSASLSSPTSEATYNILSYGPPPGLSYPQGTRHGITSGNVVNNADGGMNGNGLIHGEPISFCIQGREVSVPIAPTASPIISLVLSPSDFPALIASPVETSIVDDVRLTTEDSVSQHDTKIQEKAERKAAKKVVAAEKSAERQRLAQERAVAKAAERARIAQEKLNEKERVAVLKVEQEKERVLNEKKAGKVENEKVAQVQKHRAAQVEKERTQQLKRSERKPHGEKTVHGSNTAKPASPIHPVIRPVSKPAEPEIQVPLLSKRPKKTKPTAKPLKVPKEGLTPDETSIHPSVLTSDSPRPLTDSSSNNSRSQSLDRATPTSVEELLEDIDILHPGMDLPNHSFFDIHKINPAAIMPLEYGPLVHALSALSVGGGSFANNMPSGSIDNAVSSFQQLLETLTQTISDLLRLLPRTTWDDSSSFDGVLRDMLKGDDFLDDGGDEGQGKEDEVAALTLALERRARWMEVQLSKLEELHRDINTAAVRAVLSFNDNGWDRYGFMPRVGNTLRRFDKIGVVEENGKTRLMTVDELEKKLTVAREAAVFAETEVREVMERIQSIKPLDCD